MMGFLIAVAILWLVFGRHRRRVWAGGACLGWHGRSGLRSGEAWPHVRHHARHHVHRVAAPDHTAARRAGGEAPLESLKRRYVSGELSDEQYEQELDAHFRTTSGRGLA